MIADGGGNAHAGSILMRHDEVFSVRPEAFDGAQNRLRRVAAKSKGVV
jgi:hypothetical protein